jgi:excisionase family DNA binding protein
MDTHINITKAAEYLGVSVKTLQRWDRKGILKPMRTKTNRRVYTKAQLDEHIGRQASDNEEGMQ